ncbi:hypothetical protein PTSG_07093 [Salpingoeca rosetta]|uniref:SPRY domain-containing protein n=1 Tax=Salpingoeca rosetta (strain ATCC 50818 / BSB-021) TaxID=946362 RepID=F2UE14_SALR5|nr:uncharacterized protein PTSG_07093 [Salpingoeca rosetta]EGD74864.1 hypothetical protein PTSG_07093 [Salpingoeca rosetta]|eukprot:XP_004992509.1 hypothetical protein PTSG_07093 [Salpingoeca rosetta]
MTTPAPAVPATAARLVQGVQCDFKRFGEAADKKKCVLEFADGGVFSRIRKRDIEEPKPAFMPADATPACRPQPGNPTAHFFVVHITSKHSDSKIGVGIVPCSTTEQSTSNTSMQEHSIRFYSDGRLCKRRQFPLKQLPPANKGSRILVVLDWQRGKVIFFVGHQSDTHMHALSHAAQLYSYQQVCTYALSPDMSNGVNPLVLLTYRGVEFVHEQESAVKGLLLASYMSDISRHDEHVHPLPDTQEVGVSTDPADLSEADAAKALKEYARAPFKDVLAAQQAKLLYS